MKLRFTRRAAGELAETLDSINERSPQGSRRVKRRIFEIISLLVRHQLAGKLTSKRRLRRIVAYPYPYLIFYEATETEIIVHGIRHSARSPDSMPE